MLDLLFLGKLREVLLLLSKASQTEGSVILNARDLTLHASLHSMPFDVSRTQRMSPLLIPLTRNVCFASYLQGPVRNFSSCVLSLILWLFTALLLSFSLNQRQAPGTERIAVLSRRFV